MHLCRAFPLTAGISPSYPDSVVVLMLERKSPEHFTMEEISKRFGLTPREQETARLLGEGLTSKEIATRMNISPNTVNSFVRLMMVKMNVSSRSAIIGKIVAPKE
jgi:DNA-binding CsgD family transcriptional regulator